MGNYRACAVVRKLINHGKLPHPKSQICVDCGKQAEVYDHRDYNLPHVVDPVCYRCNTVRGPAIKQFIKVKLRNRRKEMKKRVGRPPIPNHMKKHSKVLSMRFSTEKLAHIYNTMEKNKFRTSRELFEWLWEEAFGEKL